MSSITLSSQLFDRLDKTLEYSFGELKLGRKAFFLITGAGPNSENMDFKTWEWSGNGATPTLREMETFDRRLKPEGITRFSNGARDFIFIVFDTSGYAATD